MIDQTTLTQLRQAASSVESHLRSALGHLNHCTDPNAYTAKGMYLPYPARTPAQDARRITPWRSLAQRLGVSPPISTVMPSRNSTRMTRRRLGRPRWRRRIMTSMKPGMGTSGWTGYARDDEVGRWASDGYRSWR